jgi:hypothetical protein
VTKEAGKLNISAIDVNSWLSADSTVQQQKLAIPKLLTAPLKIVSLLSWNS